jgi:SOS-response transcriptional repressor LexA
MNKTDRPPLTDFQKQVYRQIHHSSGRTANVIAQRAGLPNGKWIGRCLDRLREKGYIETDAEPQEVDGKVYLRGGKWVRARG